VALSDASKVVVGSRAEAKAVRKAALQATKARGKSVAYGGKSALFGGRASTAGAGAASAVAATATAVGETSSPATVMQGAGKPSESASASAPRVVGGTAPFMPGAVAWNAVDLALVLAMLLLTVFAKDAVLGLHAVGLMPAAGRTLVRAAVLGVYYSLQVAAFAWLAARHKATLAGAFGFLGEAASARKGDAETAMKPSAIGSLGLVLALFAGTEAFAVAYGLAMQAVGLNQPARLSSDLSAVFGGGGVGLTLSIVLVALVAPFVEEMAFRGIVLPVLGTRWALWPAVLGTATVYAAYHFSFWLFAPTFVLGIALGWLAWSRRALWPAILLHVFYNAAAVAAGFFVAR